MKTVLVFPPFHLASLYNLPPLGLINLATVLREAGHEATILDQVLAIRENALPLDSSIYQEAATMILREDPEITAFSVQCATFPAVIRITELLRERKPGLRIVVGGHDVTFNDTRTLERFPWIDAVARGEGEVTIRELVTAYAGGKDLSAIDGVTWRDGQTIIRNADRDLIADLDDLPFPDYSFAASLERYRDACGIPRSIAILEVGRGCPHRCVYCSESAMWRRRTRTFSVTRIVSEMHHMRDRYGAECFLLAYDQFTADRSFVENFCTRLIDEGLNDTPWYCISRLDSMSPDLLRLMREAGCESMCYGIDSGSERTLAFIRKQIDQTILYQRVRETTNAGMVPTLSFVIGFPEEERIDIDKTLVLALKTGIQGNSNPLLQLPTVLAGTELHHRYASRLVREVDTYFSLGLEFDSGRRLDEDTRLIESDPSLFSSFYNLPCAGLSLAELNAITEYFPVIINLYPKSFLLLSLALEKSVSSLFMQFIKYLQSTEEYGAITLSATDCRSHLANFCSALLADHEISSWEHIIDIIRYENMAVDLGGPPQHTTPGTAAVTMRHGKFPLRSKDVIITEFDWNIPEIVDHMKNGVFQSDYPREETIIAAAMNDGGIEYTEINDFGRDMLSLCNGLKPIKEVAGELYRLYGQGMNEGDFLTECREAMVQLQEMGLLRQ